MKLMFKYKMVSTFEFKFTIVKLVQIQNEHQIISFFKKREREEREENEI